jgi:monovalent cation:proton antiporter-2 (CPA2) family protein
MGGDFLFQAFIYLAAAAISVPISKRLGLGSVLGYLCAGAAIGPFGLRLVGTEGQDVMHFAEFGVVMMLFVIGLELQPAQLWRQRGSLLGLGGMQVLATAAAVAAVATASGLPWRSSVAVGLILAMSSTAIVLQTLAEKGLLRTQGGSSAFSVLLFQDVAVIPILAVMPLLAAAGPAAHGVDPGAHHAAWVDGLPGWGKALAVVGAVAVIVAAGRLVLGPALRFIARARLREAFTAAALLLVVGTALLMTQVGLSPALGTFLAGVVLASSEFRHELETDVEPFKGLLLGLFFLAVGASIDFGLVAGRPGFVLGLAAGLVLLKCAVLLVLGRVSGMGTDQNLLFSLALAQGGEFAFVLFSFAAQNGVLGTEVTSPLVAAVALSMAATPVLLLVFERWIRPRFGTTERPSRAADAVEHESPVLIAGFGRFGHIVGRFLRANGVEATVLDIDSDHVDLLRRLGMKVFYGDASRVDLLRAAGAERAKILVIAVDEPSKAMEIVEAARAHFPNLEVFSRARGRDHAYELLDAGVERIYRETLDSSLRAGVDVLRRLGRPAHAAVRSARRFRRHDEDSVADLARLRHDRGAYLSRARERIEELERLIASECEALAPEADAAWDSEPLRKDFGKYGTFRFLF